MLWLQRNAWWGLFAIAALGAVVGLMSLANGVWYQAEDVTGKTIVQIAAESDAGARLSDFAVRSDGLNVVAFDVVVAAVLLFAFRQGRPWAWWVAWALPVSAIATSALHLAFGAIGPAISGTIISLLAAAILVASAPRFFVRPRAHPLLHDMARDE